MRSVVFVEADEPIDDITAYYVTNQDPGGTTSVGHSAFQVSTGVWRVRSEFLLRSVKDVIVGYRRVTGGRKVQWFQWGGFDHEYDWSPPGADGSPLSALHQIRKAALSGQGPEQRAAAVTMVVALPQGQVTDDHRVIVERLTEARRQLDKKEWKASIAAAREACELLRKMRPATIRARPQERDLAEREAAILDNLTSLADSLFAYGSASAHPDAHLRDIAWNREHAVLILGGAASVAQLIFART